MKLLTHFLLSVTLLFVAAPLFAQLTVMDPLRVGSKSGYIDEATIVVEPHGGYVEESIYLEYGDHEQYPGNNNIEITHQFELPSGTAINDLWLWIDGKVMKGRMFDVWTGRHIYDSIVVRAKDPAFLTKNGSRYTLKIYPLVSGGRRKIKLNFIAPTRWVGGTASAELPIQMLKASASAVKPVRVLFKTNQDLWGVPTITELPLLSPKATIDSLGYRYKFFQVPDVSSLTSLSVGFSRAFENALYVPPIEQRGDSAFFQIGVDPVGWGVVSPDSGMQSLAVGLDLSGYNVTTLPKELSRLRSILHRALRRIDRFRLFVAGRDSVSQFRTWSKGDSITIDTVLNAFAATPFAASVTKSQKPSLVFCDQSAVDLWSFAGIDSFAVVTKFSDIVSASAKFSSADIVASYRHGREHLAVTNANLQLLLGRIDSLFMRGGKFLAFFDYNRAAKETIVTHYIPGFTTTYDHSFASATLVPVAGGYVSSGFLPSYTTGSVNYFKWTHTGVLNELVNTSGEPAVISAPVFNGHLVVSGLWSFYRDATQRKSLAIPMLGVAGQPSIGGAQQLRSLLSTIQNSVKNDSVDAVLVMSSADSIVSAADATTWAAIHVAGYGANPPAFHTVNLQDGSVYVPGVLTVDGVEYYGGGYQLQALATAAHGMHFETHIRDWNYIVSSLTYAPNARLDSLRVEAVGGVREQLEIGPEPGNYRKPRFFMGISAAAPSMTFDVYARFVNVPGEFHREATAFSNVDTTKIFLATMIGWENLQKKFLNSSTDTAGIVKSAMLFNLVSDYTCLLCLEPDDLHPPLFNPLDESGFVTSVSESESAEDSVSCGAYPNPFNGQTTITVRLKRASNVSITIYNMLGQQIQEIRRDGLAGVLSATWNGTNDRGSSVASGFYVVRVNIKEQATGWQDVRMLRLLLLK